MASAIKKIFGVKEKTPFGFCDGPQMSISEFFFGESPSYPKYHTTYRPLGQIHQAAAEGDAGQMEILMTLGQCSVFDRDHKNRTALHFACVYGRLPVVNILVNNNCEIDALDKDHVTPLIKSVQCWKLKCAAVLLEHGADPNIRDYSGNCALHYAVYNGHEEMASLLLKYHADIEQKTKDGFTPLLLALRERKVGVAELFVKKGADIHVVDDMRRNTLIYAIRCGSKNMATLLLQKGIDFFYKDTFGWTALRYAIEGHCTFRQMLLDFEENIHNNRNDSEPEEQMDSGNDPLAGISSCPGPIPPMPTIKEDNYNSDAKSFSERAPLTCAENTAKRKVEAWIEKDLSPKPAPEPAPEVRESVTNETIEVIELLPSVPEPELELMSVEEDMSDESENNQPLSVLEHLPQMNVGHLSDAEDEMEKNDINRQVKVEPDLEVTSKEDHNKFDDRRNIQTLRIYKDLPNVSGNVSATVDSRRKTNGQARGGPNIQLTSEEEPDSHNGSGKNPSLNIFKQIQTQNVGYLSMAKDQRGEETVVCVEKGFSKECPQSKPTIVKEQYVTVQPFLADTPKDYPLSKPTVEENDSVPNKDADIKHGKWFQEDCPNEYVQLKLPIEGKDSFVGEAPAKKQVKSYCSESSGKVASEEEQKCHDDPEKEERVGVLKQPQPRDIAYLSVANDESRENTREGQEEESPEQHRQWKSMQTTIEREDSASSEVSATRHVKSFLTAKPTIKASEQEWCGGRNVQGQDISNLSLAEDQRYERTRLDAEKGQIENITGREVVKIKKDREGLEIRLKSDVLLSSEEEKEWPDDCEGEHLKQPQPKGTAHSSMAKDERGADVISDQEKGLSPEYPELKDAIEKQDSVLTKDSTVNQEKSLMTGAETVQLRLEEEQTEWCGSNKKQRKPVLQQLQPKRNDQVSLDPEKHVKNSGVAEERGATTIQPGPKTEQTGRFVSDKKQRKPIFERFQPKWSAQAFMGPEESGENTGATEEKGATTVQPRPKTEQAGRFGRDKKRRKSIFERFQPTWSTRLFMGPEESGENTGAVEEKGATTVQLRLEEEQTKWNGSDKKPWKPVFERFHSKWSARVSVGPGESGENTGAAVKKESSVLSPIEEQTEFHGSDNPQLHNLEQLQPKWSDRVCVETKQGGDNTDAAQMTYPSDEHTESKTTIKEQDSAPAEDSTTNHEILMSEEDSQMESEEKQRSHSYENIQSIHIFKHLQPKGKDNLSMTMDQRSKNIVSGEEKEPDLEVASGDDQNRCYRSESDQSLVEKTKTHGASNGVDIAKYPCEAATSFTASADAGIAASALDELVLQRIPGEIKNQRFLIKEHAMHDGPRKKTSKKKHKITKEIRAMGDTTQSSKSVSEDDYGSSLKIQDSLNLYNALVDLKKMNKILTKNNKKLENKNNALQKEISETREEISNLQDEIVKWTEEFRNLRFTLRKELEETRNILCFYKNIKKHLSEIEKQFNERVAVTQLGIYLRTRDMGLENETNSLKEFLEAQDAYIETLKIVQKLKDHLQRVELEHSKLKVKAKDQAKKIEELRGCLHNSCEKLEQDEKLTQAGAQETLGELCENTIHSPVNQTGIQTQSRWSEPTQMKTVQESNISAPESFEQQCIEELRINNALLCELYRNRRLSESCAQVHISVEQGTPLNTSGTRFALESPCVASTCPRRHFLPCENMTLPGNPRSSEDCIRSYPVEMEDEEKSIKELTKLKQYLRCNLYQQQQKNDELEKEILRIKKFLKMRKIGHEIGECSSHGNSRTGHF